MLTQKRIKIIYFTLESELWKNKMKLLTLNTRTLKLLFIL